MGGKGSSGPSPEQTMEMQRTLQREAFEMQQQAALQQEERAARRREEERAAELERRRLAELEKSQKMAEEEKREGMIMAEAEGIEASDGAFANINLAAPQIESPDYAPRTELE
jgi:hypothetical protein